MRQLVVLILAAAAMSTAACNTIAGAGRDVTSVGRKVTETAK
jgi:predicted small secreted protein